MTRHQVAGSGNFRPCWGTINDEALQPDTLPHVLAAMEFDGFVQRIERGRLQWWPPPYLRPLHGPLRHLGAAQAATYRASYRARLAPINVALRDSWVVLLSLDQRIICVDSRDGAWRSADGANRGRDLIELGAWRWACSYGQAAQRIARLCGMSRLPTFRIETPAEMWAAIHARVQEALLDG